MALLNIIQYPHDTLRKTATKVKQETIASSEFQQFLDNLLETLENEYPLGAGLSANQVDKLWRVFVVNLEIESGKFLKTFFINPHITASSKETDTDWEGCLSFADKDGSPDQWGLVRRAKSITVTAQNREGETFTINANEFLSRLIQHETDHLNGVLFIDKVESELLTTAELEDLIEIEEENISRAG